jgi:broad specificity phosphatase PhoE
MYGYAGEHDVDVLACRHLQSISNLDNVHYGDRIGLSPKGHQQVAHFIEWVKREKFDLIVTSTVDRTFAPLVTLAEWKALGIPLVINPFFDERRRPTETQGKANDDPDVLKIHREILRNYGPGYQYSDEETFEESRDLVEWCLDALLEYGKHAKKILLKSHGLRLRMIFTRVLNGEFTAEGYRNAYHRTHYPNGGIMPLWYGWEYGNGPDPLEDGEGGRIEPDYGHIPVKSWQVAIATAEPLPFILR